MEQDGGESIWLVPDDMDWTQGTCSFDLLGTTYTIEHISMDERADGYAHNSAPLVVLVNSQNHLEYERVSCGIEPFSQIRDVGLGPDEGVKTKLIQLLHAMWLVFDYEPKTMDQGIMWLGPEMVKHCLIVAEVFAFLEKKTNLPFSPESLWQHSLRTGCLAGILAKEEQCASSLMGQACIAGFSHDIGLAILAASFDSSRYMDVMACARRKSLTLARAEQHVLGTSHEIVGAQYLQHRQFPQVIVDAVSFHDEPFGCNRLGLTPSIAVYAANILDGGGWPQDSDGMPSERSREYLSSQGFVDPWPKWQQYVEPLHQQEFRRA